MRFLILIVCLASAVHPARAETIIVSPDGSGDYPTIQAAIAAARDGDAIELQDGVFRGEGNRDLESLGKEIVIRSGSGDPEACILDCEGTEAEPHRGITLTSSEQGGPSLQGITIRNGWLVFPDLGAAVLCTGAVSASVRDCIVADNHGTAMDCPAGCTVRVEQTVFSGNQGLLAGAIQAYLCALALEGCTFVANHSDGRAGAMDAYAVQVEVDQCRFLANTADGDAAVLIENDAGAHFTDCWFEGNVATSGSILSFWLARPNVIERCTFVGNQAGPSGATLYSEKVSDTVLRNCTFWGNASPGATIWAGNMRFVVENTIIAGDTQGPGLLSPYDYAELSCSDIFGNAGGDWIGSIADQFGLNGNISADPLFCDPGNLNLYLDADSPCAPFTPENPACDLVGAWPVGCGGTPVVHRSWGRLRGSWGPRAH